MHGIERHIRFSHKVVRAAWSSGEACWTVEAECGGERRRFRARFLCHVQRLLQLRRSLPARLRGRGAFRGRIVQPQFWPQDLDYSGKRVVVIGSGATAVTLVPAMAQTAAHVTMLQRSPTYVVTRPSEYGIARRLQRRLLPEGWPTGPRAGA
jgi:monooxygenase